MDKLVNPPEDKPRILRMAQVQERLGLSRGGIYERIKNGGFPKPVKLGSRRCVGFIESEIDAWLNEKIANRNKSLKS